MKMKKSLSVLLALFICLSCICIFVGCDLAKTSTNNVEKSSNKQNSTLNNTSNNKLNGISNEETTDIKAPPIVYSEGLEYSLSEDRTYLAVKDMGTCKDTTVVIPPSVNDIPVKAIGFGAFGGGWMAKPNAPYVKEIIIPDSVTEIESQAFAGNIYINKITFGKSVEKIGSAAFYQCSSLEEIHINDINTWCNITFDSYDSSPFRYSKTAKLYANNELVTELIINDEITEIKKYAFAHYKYITKVDIGSSVTDIGKSAFGECPNLTEVKIGKSVTHIEYEAFYDCSMLLHVYFEAPSDWKCTFVNEEVYISKNDLSESSKAAAYLADKYKAYLWCKQP